MNAQKLLTASPLSDEHAELWNYVVQKYPDNRITQISMFSAFAGMAAAQRHMLELCGIPFPLDLSRLPEEPTIDRIQRLYKPRRH